MNSRYEMSTKNSTGRNKGRREKVGECTDRMSASGNFRMSNTESTRYAPKGKLPVKTSAELP